MMIFLLSMLTVFTLFAYIGGVFVAGEKIHNWCLADGWPPVFIPWVFTMMMLFGVPFSIFLACLYS